MPTRRRQQFIIGNMVWFLGTLLLFALLGTVSLELFFVVSLIGFLIMTELTAPFAVTPVWRQRLKWLLAVGLLAFGFIVIRRILAILPSGVI